MTEKEIYAPISLFPDGIKRAVNNHTALITNSQFYTNTLRSSNEVISDVFVDNNLLNIITKEYLDTDITNKTVYAPHNALYIGLPCNSLKFEVLSDSSNTSIVNSDMRYYQIIFDTEVTIGDLYKNAWMYQYEPKSKTYIKLDTHSALQQLIKPLLSRKIFRLFGYAEDRIADYGRLILFLLSKVSLSNDEKVYFNALIPFLPNVKDLQSIIDRESQLQKIVHDIKEDPLKYINSIL